MLRECAYLGRYAHQDVHAMLVLPHSYRQSLLKHVRAIVRRENGREE